MKIIDVPRIISTRSISLTANGDTPILPGLPGVRTIVWSLKVGPGDTVPPVTGVVAPLDAWTTSPPLIVVLSGLLSLPVSAGANRLLIVVVDTNALVGPPPTSASRGGVAMTQLIQERTPPASIRSETVYILGDAGIAAGVGNNLTFTGPVSVAGVAWGSYQTVRQVVPVVQQDSANSAIPPNPVTTVDIIAPVVGNYGVCGSKSGAGVAGYTWAAPLVERSDVQYQPAANPQVATVADVAIVAPGDIAVRATKSGAGLAGTQRLDWSIELAAAAAPGIDPEYAVTSDGERLTLGLASVPIVAGSLEGLRPLYVLEPGADLAVELVSGSPVDLPVSVTYSRVTR